MSMKNILHRIHILSVPEPAKSDLRKLAYISKTLVIGVLNFIRRHHIIAESLILGAIAAFLLSHIPFFGFFLGICALITFAAVGLMRELRSQLSDVFNPNSI